MAAKIMVLPGAATHALHAEQPLCDFTIAMSRQPAIKGSHHQNGAPPAPRRERKRRWAETAAVDRAPKSIRCLQTDVRIGVERQFDRERLSLGRERWQIKPMPRASKRDDAMPAIRPTAEFVIGKPGPIQRILPRIAGRTELTERQNGRERFR